MNSEEKMPYDVLKSKDTAKHHFFLHINTPQRIRHFCNQIERAVINDT